MYWAKGPHRFLCLSCKFGTFERGKVKVTEVTQIVDLITPFDYFHKAFEIVLLILSLGTIWWEFMALYGTVDAENLRRPITFSLDLPKGCKFAESTQFVLNPVAWSSQDQGNASRPRYLLVTFVTSVWDSYPCTFCSSWCIRSYSFVCCLISFSPSVKKEYRENAKQLLVEYNFKIMRLMQGLGIEIEGETCSGITIFIEPS